MNSQLLVNILLNWFYPVCRNIALNSKIFKLTNIRLDLKNCSFVVTRPWVCVKGGSARIFSILVEVSLFPRALLLFDISLVAGKNALFATIVVISLCLINATRRYNLTSKPQTLEALQNAFILIYCCEIYAYYVYV